MSWKLTIYTGSGKREVGRVLSYRWRWRAWLKQQLLAPSIGDVAGKPPLIQWSEIERGDA